ncbi:MAG: hypothetical protein F4138_08020 [Acidimicrobiia bacterium]|nr:hypothetical protein [Acidimicrobiia bacterium]MYC57615.1 hypothetical protein [Acidimicrobiia bacterium]MYG94905.1 hypothetical protein [Acidimicrobiia bacterium]MYI31254.1 hypothetical protein [Acidimicrobiia bacterium]
MLLTCWSTKGGTGTTVVSALISLQAAQDLGRSVLLVDLCGDLPASFGNPEPASGLAEWLNSNLSCDSLQRTLQELTPNLSLLPRGQGPLNANRAEELLAWFDSDEPLAEHATISTTQPLAAAPLVVVDAGTLFEANTADERQTTEQLSRQLVVEAHKSILVTRACYLSLRRAVKLSLRPSEVVLVAEAGRALTRSDCEHAIGASVVATVAVDPDIARAVDAGMLRTRIPKRALRALSQLTQNS